MADEPTPTNCNWALAVEASPAIAVSTTTAKNAFVPLISIFSLELGLVIFPASWSLPCRSAPPWRPVDFAAVSERLQKRQRSEALLTPPELRGGARVSVDRVRENYHSGLLIGSDRKMNGALNSEAASRKTLRTVDFSAAPEYNPRAMREQTLLASKWVAAQFAKPLTTNDTKVHEEEPPAAGRSVAG